MENLDCAKSDLGSRASTEHGLHRRLGFVDGVCVLVSIIIGSGIFASPGVALDRSGSPGAALVAWCVSGVIVFIIVKP